MFFQNDELVQLFREYFHWTSAELESMKYQYLDFIYRLILDESLLYIEKNNLPEYSELQTILQNSKQNVSDQTARLKFVYSLPGKYPELGEKIRVEIDKANQELMKDYWAALDEETTIKALQIMNKDMDKMQQVADKYLDKNPASTPKET
jgi:hypothetical protein